MKIRTRLVLSALAVSSLVVAGGSTLATTPDATPAAMAGMSGTPAAGMDMHQQAMTGTSAAYLTIENSGSEPDRLVGASSPAAKTVEIHEMVDDGGTMRMRPLADGLAIPANATTTLEPGGYHIMLIGLVEDLTEGDIYDLTLTFEHAGDVTVQVPVGSGAPSGPVRVVAGDLTLTGVWGRPAPAGGTGTHEQEMTGTSAAYLTIENAGSEPDRLVSASSPAAKTVEIHEMQEVDGAMRMRPLAGGLAIPASGTVALEPGGYHVMLIGLVQDLTEGDIYDLTLTFERAGDVTVQVPVGSGAPSGPVRVVAGDLTLTGVWGRPAPAIGMGTPAATPSS